MLKFCLNIFGALSSIIYLLYHVKPFTLTQSDAPPLYGTFLGQHKLYIRHFEKLAKLQRYDYNIIIAKLTPLPSPCSNKTPLYLFND